ncbi:hypothetical protein AK830_g4457 [Neonectria ditissima]|uniref:Zn(2)-C6 fungal-type domain-containing protein n=1 Tax=Neonectria ditissima TaxID=78410 RepID=A0A0N8H7L3_9HYPO|nr:hypothetical protein AK830_g4457 [Neonectria ditissima]
MRSHFGCPVCKRRKLKCDEVRPVCGPCKKSSRSCDFPDEVVFRIVNRAPGCRESGNSITGRGNEVLSFEDDQVWIDVPRNLSFVPPSLACEPPTPAPTLTIEPPAKRLRVSRERLELHDQDSSHELSSGSSYEASASPMLTPFPASFDQSQVHQEELESNTEPQGRASADEHIIALQLMRHFKEGPSQWMDLFDTAAYYSNVVPIRAMSSPLLKSSICALSAKHMHRIQSTKVNNQHPRQTTLDDGIINWLFHSTDYYHRAISHLQAAVTSEKIGPDSSSTDRERECIFAAVAILSTYELMDNPGTAWRAHLSALPLFSSSSGNSRAAASSGTQVTICRPVFWSLARQDFLCAFIGETQTRLSLDDTLLWRSAGLSLASDERSADLYGSPSGPVVMGSANDNEEDKRANEMIWLLSNIMNHLTKGDSLVPEDYTRPAKERCPVGVTQEQLLEKWTALDTGLRDWLSRLPPSFTPSARTSLIRQGVDSRDGDDCFVHLEQIWYDIPLCAAAMLSYHMARILLLVNRPQESTAIRSSITARLRCYEYTQQESTRHAREICGISLANPPDAVLLHSLEPLYVAGQALRSLSERSMVVRLFRDIQKNIGWSTSYHVTNLQCEWQEGGDWVLDHDVS